MIWRNLDSVYFVGAGGIGMSALARYFVSQGKEVAGYDRVSTPLTDQLAREGIAIHFEDRADLIPSGFRNPDRTLVVYTPAIPETHKELNYFRQRGFRVIKRSTALGEVFNTRRGIGVAGTHGKTSISTMLAHILHESPLGCNAFLGGISKNTKSNFYLDPASPLILAEADEFDRSFLTLFPEIAVVSSMDADHLDIYGSKDQVQKGFEAFIAQIQEKGKLILKQGLHPQVPDYVQVFTYGMGEGADYQAVDVQLDGPGYRFSVQAPDLVIPGIHLTVPGLLQVENALAASAVAHQLGLSPEVIAGALGSFKGVQRRFDLQYMDEKHIYIDDYAHHPEEIRAFLTSMRALFPDKKLTGVFQPHLFSRTRDFAEGFAKSLGLLDVLILLDIYPAREEPIPGVDAGMIFDAVELKEKMWIKGEQLLRVIDEQNPELLVTMGAGNISDFVGSLTELIKKKP
ncbi:MAG: UDP-N-acetylmuramate--L-alanine ligase [Bacteroidales bacterium]